MTPRHAHLAIVALFALALAAPLVAHRQGWRALIDEQGSLRRPAAAERLLTSGFPLRDQLRGGYHVARWRALGATHDSVLAGSDGWLYFRWDATWKTDPFQDLLGLNPATDNDIRRWRRKFEERRETLARAGIAYRLIPVPNKETIHAEHLPTYLLRHRAPRSRLDGLFDAARSALADPPVDLRPALLAAARERPAYQRTDTHWTDWGAYHAYRAIVASLPSAPEPAVAPEALRHEIRRTSGDLAILAHLETVVDEPLEMIVAGREFPARHLDTSSPTFAPGSERPRWPDADPNQLRTGTGIASQPTAVIFHDSFAIALLPFLSQEFRRATWRWGPYDQALVDAEAPQIVLHLRIERFIDWMMK